MVAVAGSPRLVRFLERRLGRVAERLGRIRIDLEGMEWVDPQDQYVVVALHEGFADTLALLRLSLDLRFVARDELFDWPALGEFLAAGSHLRVDSAGSASSVRRFLGQVRRVFGDGGPSRRLIDVGMTRSSCPAGLSGEFPEPGRLEEEGIGDGRSSPVSDSR